MKTFTSVDGISSPTMFANFWGPSGVGKSSALLSFPPPLYILNFDRQIQQLFKYLPANYQGNVFYEEFTGDLNNVSKASAQQALTVCERLIQHAFEGGVGSLLIDGGHRWWDMVKIAKLPKGEDESVPKDYHWPNEYARAILLALEASPLQIGITHPANTVWEGLKTESGRVKPEAFKHLPTVQKLEVFMFVTGREAEVSPREAEMRIGAARPSSSFPRHWGEIRVCKYDTSLEGILLSNISFRTLYNLCTNSDWGGELYEPGA